MSWKQPIPTDLDFGDDESAKTLFILLLLNSSNSDRVVSIDNQNIELTRGQSIFGRYLYAKKFGFKRSQSQRCARMLERLDKLHNRINIKPLNKCTIVTIKNYDSLVKINKQTNSKQTTNKHQTNTYKSEKNDKKESKGTFLKTQNHGYEMVVDEIISKFL